mmetsp:Transcript_5020/g.12753  ORF Transcript_5020/g.12753 Transcript_5020/m.12753 type:complete len:205 (+) Transcript_5020:521-1135(+)
MCVRAHSAPNTSVSFCRFTAAASRMLYTRSLSHAKHSWLSCPSFAAPAPAPSVFWNRKAVPICDASSGMYSMMASRTRQWMSSARSLMAGSSSWDSRSTPITWFTWSSLLMMLSRTSGNSSLSSVRKMGSSWSMVCALPRVGARPMMTEASAARTCWLVSPASSLTRGTMRSAAASAPTSVQKLLTFPADAMRTSASLSISSCS